MEAAVEIINDASHNILAVNSRGPSSGATQHGEPFAEVQICQKKEKK